MTTATSLDTPTALRPAAESPAGPGHAYPPSPAGPADGEPLTAPPPALPVSPARQGLHFAARPMSFAIGAHRRFGDVWTLRMPMRPEGMTVSCHPDHLQSLLKATPSDAPSLTGESPLRPILGPDSVLTAVGERHMRQRKLLLPAFHGETVGRYVEMIREVAEAEIDGWRPGSEFALAPRMQAVTLEVIMRGIFGMRPGEGGAMGRMRETIRRLLHLSTTPIYMLFELRNHGAREPRDLLAAMLRISDRQMYSVIRARRADPDRERRSDVLSLLLAAHDEEGRPLSDRELRDELMALVLAGHETTANSLAWIVERLTRTPAAYDALREAVRSGDERRGAAWIEATIHEGMRSRPVIPMIVRMVKRPWRFGEFVVGPDSATAISILGLHHRSDLYPEPAGFRPERFLAGWRDAPSGLRRPGEDGPALVKPGADRPAFIKPGTYTWIPFGGGIRRCLGASLAMAEQRAMLAAIVRRTELSAPDPRPEAPRMRNVTMIPSHGCRVRVEARRSF
ncbi:MAG TPA: cytochrome P450 [Solirubrobacteraceae bacterium]|nr:cytochrome P450 [Solirubrobacteraceae bacterium]